MNVCSIAFIVLCGALALVYQLVSRKRARQVLLSIVNIAFLVPLVPNRESWFWLALFVIGTYAAIRLSQRRPSRVQVVLALSVVIVAFLVVKRYTFLEWFLPERLLHHGVVVVGLSYMLFKFIHVYVDQQQGQIESFDFFTYVNYQLAFFTLLAGPIQRYNDFREFWDGNRPPPEDERKTLGCWGRMFRGMIKMGALRPWHGSHLTERAGTWPSAPSTIFSGLPSIFIFTLFTCT